MIHSRVKLKTIMLCSLIGILCFLTACSPHRAAAPGSAPLFSSPHLTERLFVTFDHTELPLRMWLPADQVNGVIVALHGFNDYSNFIKDSASSFNQRNLAVYSYDQRGFGNSPTRGQWSGRQAMGEDLTTFIALIKQVYPGTPVYILGESMGGAIAIVTMAQDNPPDVKGCILVAPAVWARSEMPFYQRFVLWLAAHTIPWAKVTGESLGITASDNMEMLRELGKDPLVIKKTRIEVLYGLSNLMDKAFAGADRFRASSLILYGEKDEVIPRNPVFDFYKRLPLKSSGRQRMILYENGYHMLLRDIQSEKVITDIIAWIDAQP
jgi:acylglycerol lipase